MRRFVRWRRSSRRAATTLAVLILPQPFIAVSQVVAQAAGIAASPQARVLTDPSSIRSLPNSDARPVPIENLYYTRSVFGASWSPDGREILFTSDITGRLNLWKVSSTGGWPVQLTQSDDGQYGATWSPDGKWIVYQQDAGGNELYDLYAVPSNGGAIVNLTTTPKTREVYARWSPDGKTLAFHMKSENAPVYDIALLDWQTHAVRNLTKEGAPDRNWSFVGWSADGKTIYADRWERGYTDADVYSIDVASGHTRNLTPHQGNVYTFASSVSRDGGTMLVSSNAKGGYQNVALLDVSTGKLTWVTDVQWEVSSGDFSPDGRSFTYTINADGRTEAYLADRATLKAVRIAMPLGLNTFDGNPTTYSPSGDRLIVAHESSTQPEDLWVYDIRRHTPRQLTVSAIASLHATPLPESQIVHYKTFDGKTISALLWVPFNLKPDGTNPAIVLAHGGPTGQMVDYWNTDVTALVSRGYIVIAPNVRGSTGYGIEFQKANYQDLGGGDLQDEVYAANFLTSTGYVDARRIGITGGSYGGFMTLMAVGKTPDTWAAGVDLYGIIDWVSLLKSTEPGLQQYDKSLLGDPERDRAVYENASPIKYIRNTKAPLLVLQGENDPRIPKEQSQQVVDILRGEGKTVDVHYYPAEGHGFDKREDQIDAITRSIAWFDQYLKGGKPVTTPR